MGCRQEHRSTRWLRSTSTASTPPWLTDTGVLNRQPRMESVHYCRLRQEPGVPLTYAERWRHNEEQISQHEYQFWWGAIPATYTMIWRSRATRRCCSRPLRWTPPVDQQVLRDLGYVGILGNDKSTRSRRRVQRQEPDVSAVPVQTFQLSGTNLKVWRG